MIAGIDYSMSSPAICVFDERKKLTFNNTKVFVYSDKKTLQGVHNKNIFIMPHIHYESQEERFDNISEWSLSILQKFNVTNVCLEGYAMGSSKGLVFNIAENGGLLKHKLYKNNISCITPAPTTIKKHFTGKGNAKKENMHEALQQKQNISIIDILKVKSFDSPVSDIVDSYALVDYYINQ